LGKSIDGCLIFRKKCSPDSFLAEHGHAANLLLTLWISLRYEIYCS